jgi:hypothetical protein
MSFTADQISAERDVDELRRRPEQVVEAHVQHKQEPSVVVFFEILGPMAERRVCVRASRRPILVLVVVWVVLVEFAAARSGAGFDKVFLEEGCVAKHPLRWS